MLSCAQRKSVNSGGLINSSTFGQNHARHRTYLKALEQLLSGTISAVHGFITLLIPSHSRHRYCIETEVF